MGQRASGSASRPLDDAHRRLEAVLDNASVSIFLMDDRQQCVYMNKAAEELTGYSLAEVRTLDRPLHDIIHHTHPDGSPFPLSECAIDRAFPEHNKMQGEEVFVHRNGSFYPVAFTASPIRDEASQTIGTIIEVRDTTEEKRADERQRLLLNELNHRVKNTLATVQALAWQSFKAADPSANAAFSGRLAALSKAHSILTASAWHKAGLREIIDAAIDTFGRARFSLDGRDHHIPPKVAVTLSMVLHELATNSLKYGALSVDAGRIRISSEMSRTESGERLLRLIWTERGGPPVVPPRRRGFGTRLIERQLRLEFDGKALVDWHSEGLVCTMQLKMPTGRDSPEIPSQADALVGN